MKRLFLRLRRLRARPSFARVPGIDYGRQNLIADLADSGAITHEQHNHLLRLHYPRCVNCGGVSSQPIDGRFYCANCFPAAWAAHRSASPATPVAEDPAPEPKGGDAAR